LLGALFRSRSESKSKTELVVVVTPEIAGPAIGKGVIPEMPKPFLRPDPPKGQDPR